MLSVRLPDQLEKRIKQLATAEGRTKTEVVQMALEAFVRSRDQAASAYEIGKSLFGRHGSGRGDLSVSYKQDVRKRIREKRAR